MVIGFQELQPTDEFNPEEENRSIEEKKSQKMDVTLSTLMKIQ